MRAIPARIAGRAALLQAVVSLGSAQVGAQAGLPEAQAAAFVDPANPVYSLVLPQGWRQVSPDLAREMRPDMPADLAILLNRGKVDRFGAVDAWAATGFDGRCLTIHTENDGEPELNAETLEQIQATFKQNSDAGPLRFDGEPTIGSVGPAGHPAIECQLNILEGSGAQLSKSLVFLVPTGGKTLRFSFRANPGDFEAAEPLFRKIVNTISVSSPPEGKKELSDKLQTPLIIGAVVGFLLLALYKLNRPVSQGSSHAT